MISFCKRPGISKVTESLGSFTLAGTNPLSNLTRGWFNPSFRPFEIFELVLGKKCMLAVIGNNHALLSYK